MSNWDFLNLHRIRSGPYGSNSAEGFNGLFEFALPGEARRIRVIASDGLGWQHVSVSFFGSRRTPSWEVMSKIRDLFWQPEDWVMQFHPPASEYVNNHPGCLHLWKPDQAFPVPASILVGYKELGTIK